MLWSSPSLGSFGTRCQIFLVVNLAARTSYAALMILGIKEGSNLILSDAIQQGSSALMPDPGTCISAATMPFVTAVYTKVIRRLRIEAIRYT